MATLQAVIDQAILAIFRIILLASYPKVTARYMRLKDQRRLPDPANPRDVSDKFFWRKIFDHNPDFQCIADKIAVRNWIREHEINIEAPRLRWTGKDPARIPDDILSENIVVKANHASGKNIFLTERPDDRDEFNRSVAFLIAKPFGSRWHEWAYFDIDPTILIEDFQPEANLEMKFYTFKDKIVRVFAAYDRAEDSKADIWLCDENGALFVSDIRSGTLEAQARRPLPASAERAADIARKIGAHFDHMRVDILTDGERLWFGELTIYNLGGHIDGTELAGANRMNCAWDIRNSWFLQTPQSGWRRSYAKILRRRLSARSA